MANDRVRRLYEVDYLVTPDEKIENAAVLCENDKIIAVGGLSGFNIEPNLDVVRFENAYMTNTGSTLAIRESYRIVGEYVTTFDDKVGYRKFDDAIMRFDGGAVSDVHASSSDRKAYEQYASLFANRESVNMDDYATLPYRSMRPRHTKNLLVAGRCLSADRKVLGQVRIMGYCFMMGEAAGLASYLAVRDGVSFDGVNVTELQGELLKNGVETI